MMTQHLLTAVGMANLLEIRDFSRVLLCLFVCTLVGLPSLLFMLQSSGAVHKAKEEKEKADKAAAAKAKSISNLRSELDDQRICSRVQIPILMQNKFSWLCMACISQDY